MAEIAVGGIWATFTKQKVDTCAHTSTVSVYASGVERAICEVCGHLSIGLIKGLRVPIDRAMFARPADMIAAPEHYDPTQSVFSVDRSFGLRNRRELAFA